MKEYFKINNIDVGFANHPTEGSGFIKGALNTEVLVKKGKLRISLLTPALEITDEMHNGLLNDTYYDNQRHIEYFRMVTYSDLTIETGAYNTQVTCPFNKGLTGFETYNFPEDVRFHGIIDVQEGYIHIKGDLKSRFDEKKPSIPVEVVKCFDPKPLLPKRKAYSLKDALQANPLEVYDLSVNTGVYDEFPTEILAFKNLEKLWMGGQCVKNFSTFPDAFYNLKQLHTLEIYHSKINQISEQIKQLEKLEELSIEYSEITTLPNAICELEVLADLELQYNQLLSLPENIAKTPSLKSLNITGNNFTALPTDLANIASVSVDRKHKKLYLDLSYHSKNSNPIDPSLFDVSQYPEEKTFIEKSILSIPELVDFKDLIVDYSTMATYFVLNEEQKNIPIGASKVGGAPDLPNNLKHPADKNDLLFIFHAQINCEEIAPFQNYLPRKGMLYFFVNDEEYAEKPIVLYAENYQELVRFEYTEKTEFTDSDFDNSYRESVAVSFKNVISIPQFYNCHNHGTERFPKYASLFEDESNDDKIDQLEDYEATEKLTELLDKQLCIGREQIKLAHSLNSSIFTQHESPEEQAASRFGGEPTEWFVLLSMDSIGEFSFWDAGTLTYCIHKKDLAINNFSTVHTSIESS